MLLLCPFFWFLDRRPSLQSQFNYGRPIHKILTIAPAAGRDSTILD
jgi:hypothetical protein